MKDNKWESHTMVSKTISFIAGKVNDNTTSLQTLTKSKDPKIVTKKRNCNPFQWTKLGNTHVPFLIPRNKSYSVYYYDGKSCCGSTWKSQDFKTSKGRVVYIACIETTNKQKIIWQWPK